MNKRKIFYENNEIFKNKKTKFNNDYFENQEFLNSNNIEFEFKNNNEIENMFSKINKKINKNQKKNEKKLKIIESKIDIIIQNKDMEINYLRNMLYENGIIYNKNTYDNHQLEQNEINNNNEFSFYS